MALNLAIPVLGKGGSTKDSIIQILGEQWPLSAKEIFNRVKKCSNEPVSYQAVHKCLGELVAEGVLQKDDSGYLLSAQWIDAGSAYFSGLHAAYSNDFVKSVEGKTLVFDTLYAADKFFINALFKLLPTLPKKPVLCLHWSHLWLPLFLSREDYAAIKDLASVTESYSLVRGNDAIDAWCGDFWVQRGMHKKLGVDVAATFDLIVIQDLVFFIFYSPLIKQKLDEIYKKTKNVKDLDLDDFFHSVFEKKTTVLVKVFKDPLLAEEIRKQTLAEFK